MAVINELEYKLRRAFMVLLAIYYGNKKPPMDTFMWESIDELNLLQSEGLEVDGILYTVRVIIVTVDSVARAPLLGMTQFNGSFGCGFCLVEGKLIKKGKGHARIYPEPFDCDASLPSLRTLEQHKRDLDLVIKAKKPIHGITGPTALSRIEGFNYIQALVPEYLHSCCEGAFKLMISLWTQPKFRKKDWFIGNRDAVINKRLFEIHPPYELTRTHSSETINKLAKWKASMFRSFFLYYFPILEDLLPGIYFQHLGQLVYGLALLLSDQVAVEDVKKVDILLRNFVREFELLYGEEDLRINIHFLTHLPQSVLDWGCLWSTSTFIPEWFNGELTKLCHGSQSVADQMAANYLLRLEVRHEVEELINEKSLPTHVVSQLKEYLDLPKNEEDDDSKGALVDDGKVKLLGQPKSQKAPTATQEEALKNFLSLKGYVDCPAVPFGKCLSYPRFKLLSTRSIFTTTSYTLSPKRVNYCALMKDGTFLFIDEIVYFDSPPFPDCTQSFLFGRQLGTVHKETYTPDPIDGISFSVHPGQTSKLTGIGNNIVAYKIEDVALKCVVAMKSDFVEKYVVTALVNKYETD